MNQTIKTLLIVAIVEIVILGTLLYSPFLKAYHFRHKCLSNGGDYTGSLLCADWCDFNDWEKLNWKN